jgi:tRNA-splicing ligase RtcB (3'-phosphate/5'-hydroxy nucleic acid ligase)
MIRVVSDTKLPIKIWATNLEPEAEQQARNLAGLPFIYRHVALMPDAHWGRGSTVGSVIATRGAIIPAAVGVDIGCGMCAMKLPFKASDLKDLPKLRHSIERAVPTGRNTNKAMNDSTTAAFLALGEISETGKAHIKRLSKTLENSALAIGSLGGGNHFIEICRDLNDDAWIMLHSGSRNIGKCLAEIHIDRAKDLMKQYFIDLPDPDLAFLAQKTPEFEAYLHDLLWAQQFAMANRNEMMDRVLREVLYHMNRLNEYKNLKDTLFRVNCHHNYTSIENHMGNNVYITRKGAVSAREGEWGIIPGSMGTRSFIVKGKGNQESFCSCSHGAGRRMSRTKAKATFTIKDLEDQTAGVECLKTQGVLDEIPGSYKDIQEVMDNQSDLVEPVFELKQLICIKGTD